MVTASCHKCGKGLMIYNVDKNGKPICPGTGCKKESIMPEEPQVEPTAGCQVTLNLKADPSPPQKGQKCKVTMTADIRRMCNEPQLEYKLYVTVRVQIDPMTEHTYTYGYTSWQSMIPPNPVEFTPDGNIIEITITGKWHCTHCSKGGTATQSWN